MADGSANFTPLLPLLEALDWVDQGVWTEQVAEALGRCSEDERYSQQTRHRASRHLRTHT